MTAERNIQQELAEKIIDEARELAHTNDSYFPDVLEEVVERYVDELQTQVSKLVDGQSNHLRLVEDIRGVA